MRFLGKLCINDFVKEKLFGMKTLLIVGGSSGIGYETAALFQKKDYKVINVSRTPCSLVGVTNKPCDVTVREDLDKILRETTECEKIDCFVYSAGFSMASPLEYVKEGDYRYLFEVNFFAFLHCLQVLLPALRSNDGVACVVSSLGACLPIPFDAYYSSSKAALNTFVTALNYELESQNVKVVSVMPGGTKTGFTSKRKVYPPSETDGYAKMQKLAVSRLAQTEQKGADPKKVAKTIFKSCEYPSSSVVSSCFMNKCAHALSRLMPYRMRDALIKWLYFSEEEE